MRRYVAASAFSLVAAALASFWLIAMPSALAANDLRLWLGYGASGLMAGGIGLEVLHATPRGVPPRLATAFVATMLFALLLLSAPAAALGGTVQRLGFVGLLAASVIYSYLAWWRPPVQGKAVDPVQEYIAPVGRPVLTDPARDQVARALFAAAPVYLFLVAVVGAATGRALETPTEMLLLLGWLGSLVLGVALYVWPRLVNRRPASIHLARWGAVLWHAGLILSVVAARTWLLAVTGLGGVLLAADLLPTMRHFWRSRPYIVGSRRRYPSTGTRVGLLGALVLLLPLPVAALQPQDAMGWARALAVAWSMAAVLTVLHHLRAAIGRNAAPTSGGWTPLGLALATLGVGWQPQVFAALSLLGSAYLAAKWLPGLEWRRPEDQTDRSRRPVG